MINSSEPDIAGRCPQKSAISTPRVAKVCRAGQRWVPIGAAGEELLRLLVEGMSMLKRLAVATLATLFLAGPALAEPAIYTWTGYGLNVPGSGK